MCVCFLCVFFVCFFVCLLLLFVFVFFLFFFFCFFFFLGGGGNINFVITPILSSLFECFDFKARTMEPNYKRIIICVLY